MIGMCVLAKANVVPTPISKSILVSDAISGCAQSLKIPLNNSRMSTWIAFVIVMIVMAYAHKSPVLPKVKCKSKH